MILLCFLADNALVPSRNLLLSTQIEETQTKSICSLTALRIELQNEDLSRPLEYLRELVTGLWFWFKLFSYTFIRNFLDNVLSTINLFTLLLLCSTFYFNFCLFAYMYKKVNIFSITNSTVTRVCCASLTIQQTTCYLPTYNETYNFNWTVLWNTPCFGCFLCWCY